VCLASSSDSGHVLFEIVFAVVKILNDMFVVQVDLAIRLARNEATSIELE
jgi:hypothetical protein